MTESLTVPKLSTKSGGNRSWLPYLLLGIATNAGIWGLAVLYLKIASPSYTSDFAISLPITSGAATNVSLPGLGQASSQSESPYQNASLDPRENYKFLLTSKPVMQAAAKELNITSKEFGQPRITIIANTTLMKVELAGETPEQAQNKTTALYKALQAKLNELREQQNSLQDTVLQNTLNAAEMKLKAAQKQLSEYKASSVLNSGDQITNLTTNIEQLRRQRAEVLAQQQQAAGRLLELSNNLNMSAKQAGDASILQTDPVFQKALQDYSESNAAYVSLNAKYLPSHPAVIEEKAKQDAAQASMLNRAKTLLGRSVTPATLAQLNLSNTGTSTSTRASLSQQVVEAEAQQQGYQAQAQALDRQIAQLEVRLKMLAQQESTLTNLQRDVQTAETVFSSTLARLDLGKSSISASYPQIEVFTQPSLARAASSPQPILVLLGAALGSVFCTNGVFLLWLRQRKKRMPKRVDSKSLEATTLRAGTIPEMLEFSKNGKENTNSKQINSVK